MNQTNDEEHAVYEGRQRSLQEAKKQRGSKGSPQRLTTTTTTTTTTNGFISVIVFAVKMFLMSTMVIMTTLPSPVDSIEIDNGLIEEPEVECGSERVEMQFRTFKPFRGKVFVKGHFNELACRQDYSGDEEGRQGELTGYGTRTPSRRPIAGIVIPHGSCDMRRQRMISPVGMQFSAIVVISFHPTFITKVDRAFHIKCMYRELFKTVTSGLTVQPLTTEVLNQDFPMPTCTYTVRKDEIDGEILKYARVGQQVVHRWECQSEVYGILVHSCYITDGQGERVPIVDNQGCHVDRYLLGDPTYTEDLNLAYRESHVFKFADRVAVRFQCQIRLCMKADRGCVGVTPPLCQKTQTQSDEIGYRRQKEENELRTPMTTPLASNNQERRMLPSGRPGGHEGGTSIRVDFSRTTSHTYNHTNTNTSLSTSQPSSSSAGNPPRNIQTTPEESYAIDDSDDRKEAGRQQEDYSSRNPNFINSNDDQTQPQSPTTDTQTAELTADHSPSPPNDNEERRRHAGDANVVDKYDSYPFPDGGLPQSFGISRRTEDHRSAQATDNSDQTTKRMRHNNEDNTNNSNKNNSVPHFYETGEDEESPTTRSHQESADSKDNLERAMRPPPPPQNEGYQSSFDAEIQTLPSPSSIEDRSQIDDQLRQRSAAAAAAGATAGDDRTIFERRIFRRQKRQQSINDETMGGNNLSSLSTVEAKPDKSDDKDKSGLGVLRTEHGKEITDGKRNIKSQIVDRNGFSPVDGDFTSQYIYVLDSTETPQKDIDNPLSRSTQTLSEFLHGATGEGAIVGEVGEGVCLSTGTFAFMLISVLIVFLGAAILVVFLLFCRNRRMPSSSTKSGQSSVYSSF